MKRSCASCAFWHEDKSCGAVEWEDPDTDKVPDDGAIVKLLNITEEEYEESSVGAAVYTGPNFYCISHRYKTRETL